MDEQGQRTEEENGSLDAALGYGILRLTLGLGLLLPFSHALGSHWTVCPED